MIDEAGHLKRSRTGWLLLAGMGVSYVIGGDFSAWNFGLARAGWGGMMIAVAIAALIWIALMMTLAELSSILPTAGGGLRFAEEAFGSFAGRLTGYAIMVEYGAAAAVVAIFVEAYFKNLTGFGGWLVILLAFAIPIAIHLRGARETMGVVFTLTLVAIAGILIFGMVMAPYFSVEHLLDLAPVSGGSPFLPFGLAGIWAAMPFATAFFLAVEGIAMAAEEVADPQHVLPQAMITSVIALAALAVVLLLSGPGAVGVAALVEKNDPLTAALGLVGAGRTVTFFVNIAALVGLGACMFSAIYAFSRQAFALARAGHLPSLLAQTNAKGVPLNAILMPSIVALGVAFSGMAEGIFVAMVFAAMVSYLFMTAAHVALRFARPELDRPYKAPGGIVLSGSAFLASLSMMAACVVANISWSICTVAVLTALLATGKISLKSGRL